MIESATVSEPDAPPAVLTERRGHVLEITLNRPEKKNPFNPEMLVRLADIWDELDADDELRVAIVTGAGGTFSAGADLDRLVGALMAGEEPADDLPWPVPHVRFHRPAPSPDPVHGGV